MLRFFLREEEIYISSPVHAARQDVPALFAPASSAMPTVCLMSAQSTDMREREEREIGFSRCSFSLARP